MEPAMTETDNSQQILLANIVVCCFSPLVANIVAICVVASNKQVNAIVRSYLLCQHAIRSYKQLMRIAFDSTCTKFEWCMATDFAYLLNVSVGTLENSLRVTTILFEMAVSLNRLFAIILGGLFYRRVSKRPELQCSLMFVVPMLFYVPWQIAGAGHVFVPIVNQWAVFDNDNPLFFLFLNIIGYMQIWVWYVVPFMDFTTMFLLRKRFGSQEREIKQEVRLAKQVLVQHLLGVAQQVFPILVPAVTEHLIQSVTTRSFLLMLVMNWFSQLMNTVMGLNTIYFLRDKTRQTTKTITVKGKQ